MGWWAGEDEVRRSVRRVHAAHVSGHRQHRHPGRAQRALHGLFEHARELFGTCQRPAERRHIGEQDVVVDLLKEVRTELGERHLTADGEHRGMRLLGVIEAVEQMDGPGPDGSHADPERAGELRLGAGGERAGLLVTDADPLKALLAPDRVGDRVQGVADDAPDVGDPEVGHRGDDRLRDGRHQWVAAVTRGAKLSGSARSQSSSHASGGSWSS